MTVHPASAQINASVGGTYGNGADKADVEVIETIVTSECSIICRPIGDLDWVGAVYLRDAVAGILQPGIDLLIDFSLVEFVDDDGIVALRNSVELVHLVGGNTRFCGLSPEIRDALDFSLRGGGDTFRIGRHRHGEHIICLHSLRPIGILDLEMCTN